MVGKMNSDQRADRKREPGLLRCPACLLIRDFTLKDFTCTLTRCPRTFVNIEPPTGSQPAGVRVELETT